MKQFNNIQDKDITLAIEEELLAIENRLQRNTFVEANQISVTVDDGIATLSGRVDIWQQRNVVISTALKGGAKSIVSQLKVDGWQQEEQEEKRPSQ